MTLAPQRYSRRRFLRGATALAGFTIVPRHCLGGVGHTPPSETVYVASVGAGGRAGNVIRSCHQAGARIVALCDVDETRASDSRGTYPLFPDARKYRDFRKMLDREKGIDAVIVGTPDHTHAVAAMAAMRRGKHVYSEKPLAHTLHEVRTLTKAARKYKVATQLGNQGHSDEKIRLFCEWTRDGAIGPVREVHAFCDSSYSRIDQLHILNERPKIPSTLDWDLWLGPVAYRAYHSDYAPSNWRKWSAFGTGVIGDWVCHIVDPVFWALKLGAPAEIEAETPGYDPQKHGETFPAQTIIRYSFPARGDMPPVKLTWYDGGLTPNRPAELDPRLRVPKKGAIVIGEHGKMMYGSHGAGGLSFIPHSRIHSYEKPAKTIPRSVGHSKEWLLACKGGNPAGSNFDYGGPLTEIALLGVIAIKLSGQTLEWDSERFEFRNNPEANAHLQTPYREGWTL